MKKITIFLFLAISLFGNDKTPQKTIYSYHVYAIYETSDGKCSTDYIAYMSRRILTQEDYAFVRKDAAAAMRSGICGKFRPMDKQINIVSLDYLGQCEDGCGVSPSDKPTHR